MPHLNWRIWCAAAVMLLTLEAVTPGFLLACFSAGAFAAAAASLKYGEEVQLCVFAAASVMSVLLLRPVAVRLLSRSDLKTNADAIAGKSGVVLANGYARVDGLDWRIDGEPLPEGTRVTVISVGGATVKVRPED